MLAGYLPFAEDLGYDGPSFGSDPEHRALIKAKLGAYFAYLYALSRDYIVSTGNGSGKSLTYLCRSPTRSCATISRATACGR
jgi:hypothetical protein